MLGAQLGELFLDGDTTDDIGGQVQRLGFDHHGIVVVGPQAVLEGVFMRPEEIGDDCAVVPEQFVADGDTVVALGNYPQKRKSSGEPAVVKMLHVWTLNAGKAVGFQQHVDSRRVREVS